MPGGPIWEDDDLLGHSQTSVTVGIFPHVLDEMKRQTAGRLNEVLPREPREFGEAEA